ncbi:serine/threonine protein kinase [Laspinema palackyanum]|uniref:serine/threonine protein kinase n=1 Tax=Laspinema palackyanum TaxID=3231601 RepID=UPI00345DBB74|nr:serine/threonine protein kinase [Laspinema sp. D2c]
MSYCLNPSCPNPSNPVNENTRYCSQCGADLLVAERCRALHLLGSNSYEKTFEVTEAGTAKILKVLQIDDPVAVTLFQQQALLLGKIQHPGIPQLQQGGYFSFAGTNSATAVHGMLMEKVAGLNLEQWMKNRGYQPISQDLALKWLQQIAEILQPIHQTPYLHLNIKPSNIILTDSGQLVLIDFGTARQVSASYLRTVELSPRLSSIDSGGYTPPEQLKHEAVAQSDFFALGRTMVYLLTAMEPLRFYSAETSAFSWRDRAPQISEQVADLIDRLMDPSLSQRIQTVEEILQQLRELQPQVMQMEWGSESVEAIAPSPGQEAVPSGTLLLPGLQLPSFPQLLPGKSEETVDAASRFKGDRKGWRLAGVLGIWAVIGLVGGMGSWFLVTRTSSAYQCQRLLAMIDEGGQQVTQIEGTDATAANKMAQHLDRLAEELLGMKISDTQVQPYPLQLGKSYQQLSLSFRQIGEAIAIVDAAPLSKAGLDQVKAARKKAEEAGRVAALAAKTADGVAGQIHNSCKK